MKNSYEPNQKTFLTPIVFYRRNLTILLVMLFQVIKFNQLIFKFCSFCKSKVYENSINCKKCSKSNLINKVKFNFLLSSFVDKNLIRLNFFSSNNKIIPVDLIGRFISISSNFTIKNCNLCLF